MKHPRILHVLFLSAMLAAAGALFAGDGPTPYPSQSDEAAWPGVGPIRLGGWMKDNRAWFWTQRDKARGSVVFVGDSLVGGWKTLAQDFPNLKTANRAIGGDVSRGVLFRFQEDVLDLNPRAVVLCVGSNDLSTLTNPANAAANIAAIVGMARKQYPAMPIILCTVPPREAANAPIKPGALKDLNARLTAFGATQKHLVVADLFTALATPDGKLDPENFAKDRIHLAPPGFVKWAALLRPIFESLGIK